MTNKIETETSAPYNALSHNMTMAKEDAVIEQAMVILKGRIRTY